MGAAASDAATHGSLVCAPHWQHPTSEIEMSEMAEAVPEPSESWRGHGGGPTGCAPDI